ncbi:unnamed protein product, partial [Meganyctiphanes norvegica]
MTIYANIEPPPPPPPPQAPVVYPVKNAAICPKLTDPEAQPAQFSLVSARSRRGIHIYIFIVFQRKSCTKSVANTVKKRLPIVGWIRGYNVATFITDMVAGLTVGLMLIPQALAYGTMAGLTPSHGLYAGWAGCFVYFFLGSTKELTIGPTAILILMVAPYTARGGADYAIFLCFMNGIIILIASIFNLGFLINFISQPVINGFTTAAVVLGGTAQLKPLLGLNLQTSGTFDTWVKVVTNIGDYRREDLGLGVLCMAVLTLIQLLPKCAQPFIKKPSIGKEKSPIEHLVFYLSNGRNAIVVIVSSIVAVILDGDQQPFTLTGYVKAGIPTVAVPPFSVTIGNETLGFTDMVADIGIGVVMIPFIAILYNIGILSTFAKGKTIDATQEIFALSVSNILASFFGSMPITSCMSRTAVNCASGAKTPMGGLLTGTMVLLALVFLTPYFRFIPKATLAAVIICALVNMLDHQILKNLWRSTRRELIPYFITFLACFFFGLSTGILTGIAVNLSMLLFFFARPKISISTVAPSKEECRYVQVKISHGVQYPSSSHVRTAVNKAGLREACGFDPVVVDCSQLQTLDYTAAKGFVNLSTEFKHRGQQLVLLGLNSAIISTVGSLLKDLTVCSEKDNLYDILKAAESYLTMSSMGSRPKFGESPSVKYIDASNHTMPSSENGGTTNPLLTPET